MKVFDSIINKKIDDLADWFNRSCEFDGAPWFCWWDKNYCKKCEGVIRTDDDGCKRDYAYCELYGNCRFFKDMKEIPDNKQIVKMWLESECE